MKLRELLSKDLKWVIGILVFLLGIKLLVLQREGHSWGLFPAMLCFGLVYWQFNSKNKTPWQVFVMTGAILALAGAVVYYLPVILDFPPFNSGFFTAWASWTVLLGVPMISWTFKEFD